MITALPLNPVPAESVVLVVDTAAGYPEISYFNTSYFYPSISDDYKQQF